MVGGELAKVVTMAALSPGIRSVEVYRKTTRLVIGPGTVGRTTIVIEGERPTASGPIVQTTRLFVRTNVPRLGDAEINVAVRGIAFVTTKPLAVEGPRLVTVTT